MIYHLYDSDGYFISVVNADEQPENSTSVKTPDAVPGNWLHFNGRNWDVEKIPDTVEDIIGLSVPAHPASMEEEDKATQHERFLRSIIENILSTTENAKGVIEDGTLTVVAVSKEEQEAKETAEAFAALRAERDKRIAATDYLMAVDYPLSDENKAKIMAYRQALRDLPAQEGAPWMGTNIPWPELTLD